MKNKALFLDRDGVINVDYGYVSTSQKFHFIGGIFELVATANKAGYLVIVITNQSGIGRGDYSELDFHRLTNWMREQFTKHGAHIDAVYHCPNHPTHGIGVYKQDCAFRKPKPGMFLLAAEEHDIDLKKSILIGDSLDDSRAGLAARVGTIYHFGKKEPEPLIPRVTSLIDLLPMFQKEMKDTTIT